MTQIDPIFRYGYTQNNGFGGSYPLQNMYKYKYGDDIMGQSLFNFLSFDSLAYSNNSTPDYALLALLLKPIEFPKFNLGISQYNNNSGFSLSNDYECGAGTDFGRRMAATAKKYKGCNEANGTHMRFITSGNEREPWCADFVSYVARECGIKGFNYPGVKQIHDWGDRNKRLTKTPQVGDVVIFQKLNKKTGTYYFCHTGIVTDVRNGRVYTIEGNSSDAVLEHNYALNDNYIREYVRLA